MPKHLSQISISHIKSLIDYWKSKSISVNTILNKLAAIRFISKHGNLNLQIPSNKTLNLTREKKHLFSPIPIDLINYVHHPIVKSILEFQIFCGLTKMESIRWSIDQKYNDDLMVPPNIAFNQTARSIPLITKKQREIVKTRKDLLKGANRILDVIPEHLVYRLYEAELYYCDIKHTTPFHYWYAQNRMKQLQKIQSSKDEVYAILMHETGLHHKNSLLEILWK